MKKSEIGVRLPDSIIKKIRKTAKLNGLNLSEQIRQHLLEIYGVENESKK